jgi:hypothetical protein
MRSIAWLSVITLLSLCTAAAVRPASYAAAADTGSRPGLTPELRTNFLATAENSLRRRTNVSPEFWDWLDRHPQIRAGLLSAADPVPVEFAENLDSLRIALGADVADRYADLLLGASLGRCYSKSGDGAYTATAVSSPSTAQADPRVKQTADYLKTRSLTLVDFLAREDAIFSELKLPPVKKKERSAFLDQLAFVSGTYPTHQTLTLADELKKIIAHYETKLPPFADKGPQWPLFPLDTAPWPLLAPMRQTISDRELDYLWERFSGKVGVNDRRLVTYSKYTWDYEKPEVRYKKSEWYPTSIPRIIEDGGVCGRQSTLAQLSQVGLGRPAVGMYQPGHRALLSYRFDATDGHYSAFREQSITSPEKSTCQWYLPEPTGLRANGNVGVEYHFALALAMNAGLERYTDSRIAFLMARRLPAGELARRQALLDSAVNLNPYNLDAWYALAKIAGADTAAVNRLLARFDTLMASPDSGLAAEAELEADTDLNERISKPQPQNLRRDANLVASLVGDAIAEAAYLTALSDKKCLSINRANLSAEMIRRAQLNLPHGLALQGLVYRYDIAAEGPTKTELAVAAEIKKIAAEKPGKRKQQADAVRMHAGYVLAALTKPADRVAWLSDLYRNYPEAAQFQIGKNGKAAAEPLYGYLHVELLAALKATGPHAADECRVLSAEFEATRSAFECKAGKQ